MNSSMFTFPPRISLLIFVKYSWMFSTTVSVASPERIWPRTYLQTSVNREEQHKALVLTLRPSSTKRNILFASYPSPWPLWMFSLHLPFWQQHTSSSVEEAGAGRPRRDQSQEVCTARLHVSWIHWISSRLRQNPWHSNWRKQNQYHRRRPRIKLLVNSLNVKYR